jgi:hypothetical protein
MKKKQSPQIQTCLPKEAHAQFIIECERRGVTRYELLQQLTLQGLKQLAGKE